MDKIFVVHGHDELAVASISRFIERIGLECVILHERSNRGQTIIEKFERHADVSFAVVLLTDDDIGGKNRATLKPRARQNVILELGYFIGKLGRSRVCALKKGNVELPSDILGIIWIELDEKGAWKVLLAREMKESSHVNIDWELVGLS